MFKRAILDPILSPIVRPLTRYTVRTVAVPGYRFLRRRVPYLVPQDHDRELEKDIEEWFRGSLLLLTATKNFELWIGSLLAIRFDYAISEQNWILFAGRLLLAIAVIEAMPDQELFSLIHPGPPKFEYDREQGLWPSLKKYVRPLVRGLLCQHLNRSSPVFAIIAVILGGTVGWVCYGMAVLQYLIIGLVTSRDRAKDVLARFDEEVAERRKELIDEFQLEETKGEAVESSGEGRA
ncbi:MAG: DNA topoisomerase I [Planctomycetota bacterium]|nr:MAG: DNA topoisomerase I [Planctomycetota bacterium]REJ97768.1 MAG: DNA topoisomerase I [Planctomycetota bacterium]REK26772.1 MAG: DNA topoisomerase I [Planctomycetota bacterium]REK35727.1 MAG: DNA topoisomerase I [Planctomycetota bacterium]